ncbi:MAG: elongation factor G [Phyllobacterium sp.]
MENSVRGRCKGPKCIAIVGPFASGKTTLLEAILARTGAIAKQSPISAGQTVGDASPEARAHMMSVEATAATTEFMGESMTFIDCPGSVEFSFEAEAILAASDAAIVVVEPDEKKLPGLQLIMRQLDELGIPKMLFLNKIEKSVLGIRDVLKILQSVSQAPLLLRQIPIRKDGIIIGSIDLALERAYIYREYATSEVQSIADEDMAREVESRFDMLEKLADFDDRLMEYLLDEVEPPRDNIFDDLAADLREGKLTPVLIGSAEKGNGIHRLLKAIRHDAPDISFTRERLGVAADGGFLGHVMKTVHTSHGGKLSVTRILSGTVSDSQELATSDGGTAKISGIYSLLGREQVKRASAGEGETVALGKLEDAQTGDTLGLPKTEISRIVTLKPPQPVYSIALRPKERKDEVKLSTALQKLREEDPSLKLQRSQDSSETVLSGHGEMHLRVALERLENKFQIPLECSKPSIPYRETIRKGVTQRGRHKKQSGGHGQFGDIVLDIKPLPRASGFEFTDTITGGVVPKQYFSSVETGVQDSLKSGPLGFPVVDIAVNLSDGSYHTVDSSDMAFQMAARLAMKEGLAVCSPVLLEPIMKVRIATPSDATAKIISIVPQRRGQILGYDSRPDWLGWDVVEALMPQAEIDDLIIELRSVTAGAASYTTELDHLAELTGRLADEIVKANNKAA